MKKHNLYFLLTVLLAGLFASCSQEDMDGPQTNKPSSVTLSANVDGGIHTRADGKVTIPYFAFKLRYILEVWTTGANPELIYREEKTNSTGEGEDFTFTLVDNGDYKALLWADFVKGSGETTVTYSGGSYTHYEDQYYTTIPDLKTVTISNLALDGAGTSFSTITPRTSLDAFYACHTISKKDGAYAEPVVLTRPFGQINISEKDADALANVYRVKFAYNVPAGFNVESGKPTQTTVQTKTIQELDVLGSGDFTANLYYDYVFTPATGQTTLGEMTVTFAQEPGSNIVIADYKIPANMPVVRNKRTNISGHIVSVSDKPSPAAKLSVTVSDGWTTPGEDIELPSVGDYFYSDGTFSSTEQAGKTLTGIVFWTNPDNRGKGKIVSLDQVGYLGMSTEGVTWADAQNTTSANPLPEGMTWRLPTKVELQHLWCAYNGAEPTTWVLTKDAPQKNTTANAAFGSKLTGKFGNYYYWSSEEDADNTDNAWNMTFSNGNTASDKKTRQNRVRWVSDF